MKRGPFLEGEGRAHEERVEDELKAGLALDEVQEEGLNFGPRDSPGRARTVHPRALICTTFLNFNEKTCLETLLK